jgi:hypothetical protein
MRSLLLGSLLGWLLSSWLGSFGLVVASRAQAPAAMCAPGCHLISR